jgi:hypothetical protein
MSKLPRPPRVVELVQLGAIVNVLPAGTRLRRIYFQGGSNPARWDSFRFYGPIDTARFDHHIPPPSHDQRGILYAATEITTCLAEVFQGRRVINTRRREPWLVSLALTRDVVLLDLTGVWPTKARASMAINTGPRGTCRLWSQRIYEAYPQVDGLYYCSSMHANRPAVALYERAMDALPARPLLHRPLKDPMLFTALRNAAHSLGYRLV